jgi:hypothetical protein
MTRDIPRRIFSVFAVLFAALHTLAAQTNEHNTFYAVPSSELGAQITNAIHSGFTNIKLTPGANYTMTTQVTNAGQGIFIDCQGSTITATYTLGPLIEWNNQAGWLAQSINAWVHPATGIAHCKFQPPLTPSAITSMYVGQVTAISHFTATDITILNGGAFRIVGPSILGVYDGVRVIDPTTKLGWHFILGGGATPPTGWYGPNGNQILNSYFESVEPLYFSTPITEFEVDSGTVTASTGYTEAIGLVAHVNGGIINLVNEAMNFRTTVGQAVQWDCTSPSTGCGGFSISGGSLSIEDNNNDLDSGIVFNAPPQSGVTLTANITNLSISFAQSNTAARSNIFYANQPVVLNLSGSFITVQQYSYGPNIFNASKGGYFSQSSITGNNFYAIGAGVAETTNWVPSGATGNIFVNGVIADNVMNGISNIIGLESVVYTGNSHSAAVSPAITFTGQGIFGDNYFGGAPGTLTLDGSQGGGNNQLSDNEFRYAVKGNVVIPNTATGFHGSTAVDVQMSDTTGTRTPAFFDANGNLTATVAPGKLLANCGTMTTTASSNNAISCAWVTASSNCMVTPSNSTAVAWAYYMPAAGTVTVYHTSTAGANYAIACSAN